MNRHHDPALPVLPLAFAAFFLSLSCQALFAEDPISMATSGKDDSYDIEGHFDVQTTPDVVWDVLTGYERIPRFVGSLKKSNVEENLGPYHFLLEQEFEGGFLFITKRVRVLLDVHEVWQRSIEFTDIDHRDFTFYQGSWRVDPDPTKGLRVTYRLLAHPNFSVPFAGDYMNSGAKDLLEAVRREILRMDLVRKKEVLLQMTAQPVPQPTPMDQAPPAPRPKTD